MQRLKQWGHWLLGKGYRMAMKDAKPCPSCWKPLDLPAELPETGLNTIVSCRDCGWRGTIDSLALSQGSEKLTELPEQPEDSRIVATRDADGRHSWWLPARGKFNWVIGIGVFWLAIVAGMTLLSITNGSSLESDISAIAGQLIIALFWLPGIGMLTLGLWMAFTSQNLLIEPGGPIISERRFFGFTFRRLLEWNERTRVRWVESHQENDSPVYTVELGNGKKERLRLSSQLNDEELRWMFGQLRETLGQPADASPSPGELPLNSSLEERVSKTLTIRRLGPGACEIVLVYRGWTLALVMGLIFVAVAGFLGWDSIQTMNEEHDPFFDWLNWPFVIVPGLMSAIFGVVGLAGVGAGIWLKGRKRVLTFSDGQLLATTLWRGSRSEETIPREEFDEVTVNQVGSQNGETRYSVKLIGPKRAFRVCGFRGGPDAALIAAWARDWLSGAEGA